MNLLERLRALVEAVPPGGAVTIPRDWLATELDVPGVDADAGGDLTVEQLAKRLSRKPSTVRGWLDAGLFPGAYHLPASGKRSEKTGRAKVGAWRIPPAAIEAFRAGQQSNGSPRRRKRPSLGDWRNVTAADAG